MIKRLSWLIVLALAIPVALNAQQAQQPQLFKPTVLVEFFTSEGCSSCPEADKFAQEIKGIADSAQMLVYTIDWHVDLWDKSGWKDPFSDSIYTARQLNLAQKNNQQAVFTPMAFVNGQGALPGGAKSDIGKLIQNAVSKPSNHFLLFSASWFSETQRLMLEYEIKGKPDSCDVFFVLVEKEIHNPVTAGENSGKILTHHNVVRKMEMERRGTEFGTVPIHFATSEVDFSRYRVIGFLQHKRTFQVLAAQVLEFNFAKKEK
jgi:hypothetical protein